MVWPWTLTFWPKKRNRVICPKMHQWQKFGENLKDTGDIVETWKSGMHSVMPWPWTLTFWTQNLIGSSLSRDAPVTKVWRKSVNRYWRYRGNIKLPRESRTDRRTDGRTTRKHIASAGAYRRWRLKNFLGVLVTRMYDWCLKFNPSVIYTFDFLYDFCDKLYVIFTV